MENQPDCAVPGFYGRGWGVSMQSLPLAIAASSPSSPLLGAYALWSGAQFGECVVELQRLESDLSGLLAAEGAVLSARAYLRLDRPADALLKLTSVGDVNDVDVRCTAESLRGIALVSVGRGTLGMRTLSQAIKRCERGNARLAVRMEAVFLKAFGHWLLGEYDEAEDSAKLVSTAGVDIVSARALALAGWIAVGRLDYARSLALFHNAWRACRSCVGRDAHLEASLIHAIATYQLQLLDRGDNPRYHGEDLPAVGKAIDTYRLLVGVVDAWRATLAGERERALEFAAATEAVDVADHWRVFGMASRAGLFQALGYGGIATALSSAAFDAAMALEWSAPPGESGFALLYLAERLAPYDLDRAATCMAAFARIRVRPELRYFSGGHPLHEAVEYHSRGVVAAASGAISAGDNLKHAAELYDRLGFRWRAAGARLLCGRLSPSCAGAEFRAARAMITHRFPKSHLASEIDGFLPMSEPPPGPPLSTAQGAIVRALCAGRTPREIATDRGTSIGTVRNQLKEIYRRTGRHSIRSVVSAFRQN